MAAIDELSQLRSRLDRLRQDVAKATGALDQVLSQLKGEFGCDDLEEAERKLKALTKEAKTAETVFLDALEEFKSEHSASLA